MIDLNNIARQSLKIAEHRKLETDALSCIKHCAGEIAEATQAVDNYQSCVCEETEKQIFHCFTMAAGSLRPLDGGGLQCGSAAHRS